MHTRRQSARLRKRGLRIPAPSPPPLLVAEPDSPICNLDTTWYTTYEGRYVATTRLTYDEAFRLEFDAFMAWAEELLYITPPELRASADLKYAHDMVPDDENSDEGYFLDLFESEDSDPVFTLYEVFCHRLPLRLWRSSCGWTCSSC